MAPTGHSNQKRDILSQASILHMQLLEHRTRGPTVSYRALQGHQQRSNNIVTQELNRVTEAIGLPDKLDLQQTTTERRSLDAFRHGQIQASRRALAPGSETTQF